MSGRDEPLHEDVLFLACTRPALVAGVPMEAMGLNLIVSACAFLAAKSLLYLLIAPALHLVFRAIGRSDPHAFRVLFLYVQTKGRARTRAIWGGSSPSPLPPPLRFARAARA